ncbi:MULTISPECIES: TetR/AcrR family transcriptional regulator [Nocardiaceae]|uniref:TetR/AcrR family transcriptional regulator n=1 Tax=Nocardiaceae TaxID=85025 RepID=UPI00050C3613|nr:MULTISPECIES: TetR/AcrR family transcriptional regulator [Rhodococcus]OZC46588.1 TetR/AcrR family transcriptional regulator [Rhodococcus sp. WWJCD1]
MPAAPESDGDLPNRELPITPRGLRTRSSLVAAARRVFEESGYLDSRLIDITRAARCSAGTFYTYFTSKEEILAAVLEQARDDMLHPGTERVDPHENPVAVIAASNRAYFEAYQRNAKLMALLEQVSNIDPEFRRLRRERADAFVRRNARSIESLQNRGLADTELDPLLASRALSSMISRLAFNHFVVDAAGGRSAADYEGLLETATRLWVNALRLPFTDDGDAERGLDA